MNAEIDRIFRRESGRAVASLVRRFGDIDVAEEAVQEAFIAAIRTWPETGIPPTPAGWIITTARNRAIDRFRRESSRHDRQVEASRLDEREPDRPGPYQVQAAIAAVHANAPAADDTDWSQIVQLYDQLMVLAPTPIVALNRAIALTELEGPAVALAALDGVGLDGYHLFHAARADLLERLGRVDEAATACDRALAVVGNAAERALLERRRFRLTR